MEIESGVSQGTIFRTFLIIQVKNLTKLIQNLVMGGGRVGKFESCPPFKKTKY